MIAAVLLGMAALGSDSLPRVTLSEAIHRATRLSPNYVAAVAQLSTAEWARKAAFTTFISPSLSVATDMTAFSVEQFNIGIGRPARTTVNARVEARYELFTGGRKTADYRRLGAELEMARAGEQQQLFLTALGTERDYYAVLSGRELLDVARQRLARAQEQLVIARARVVSGAVVQTDSLQILLEVNRAQVALLREEAQLAVSRLQLGRRIGQRGAVDAAPLDSTLPSELPITVPAALALALEQGPEYRMARGNERATQALVKARNAAYLPQANLVGSYTKFGDAFPPTGIDRGSISLQISLPIWDNLNRETAVRRARAANDIARAVREDLERAAEADITEAYEAHRTARAASRFAEQGVRVAEENYRVQQARYRAGASTILDLLDAQSQLTEAQSELVQSRYATRLAQAGLEVLIGRRFTEIGD